ncbi:MAG: PEP-CTERM sorting domain-containing protein [Candidatus Zixiibacteriota bacterium]|nr:MAG: PEP-CTERM sorting domain-containing protein [candidate division Zixibacteria bacterium]
MRRCLFAILVTVVLLGSRASVFGFNFFVVTDSEITQIGAEKYRLSIFVDYHMDDLLVKGIPTEKKFFSFQVSPVLGTAQYNVPDALFATSQNYLLPGYWEAPEVDGLPYNLFGNEFAYDFDFAGEMPPSFELDYAAEFAWVTVTESGYRIPGSEVYSGSFTVSAAPEPGSLILLAVGLVGIVVWRKLLP